MEMTYIEIRQANVAQWVALRPIFEVCAGEKGYKGGRRRREYWWRQEETEKKLRYNLAGVSWETNRRRKLGEIVTQ